MDVHTYVNNKAINSTSFNVTSTIIININLSAGDEISVSTIAYPWQTVRRFIGTCSKMQM